MHIKEIYYSEIRDGRICLPITSMDCDFEFKFTDYELECLIKKLIDYDKQLVIDCLKKVGADKYKIYTGSKEHKKETEKIDDIVNNKNIELDLKVDYSKFKKELEKIQKNIQTINSNHFSKLPYPAFKRPFSSYKCKAKTLHFAEHLPKLNNDEFTTIRDHDKGFKKGDIVKCTAPEGREFDAKITDIVIGKLKHINFSLLENDVGKKCNWLNDVVYSLQRHYPDLTEDSTIYIYWLKKVKNNE